MLLRRASLVLFGLSLSIASTYLANGQTSCPSFPTDELGSTSGLSNTGLVSSASSPQSEQTFDVRVRIVEYNYVCDASGPLRDTSTYVSVLVTFLCSTDISAQGPLSACNDGTANITWQFQFSCVLQDGQPTWSPIIDGSRSFVQTRNPTATFTTPLSNRCIRCIDDERSDSSSDTDSITHCEPCRRECTEGMRRCFFNSQFDEECCNYYDPMGRCVETCPGELVGGEDFNCVCPLLGLRNGSVTYAPENRRNGSVATHTCDFSHELVGDVTRTCGERGWEGQPTTCNVIKCKDLTVNNGIVEIEPIGRLLNSKATYICDPGYSVKGNNTRFCREDRNWTGSDLECADCSLQLFPDCLNCGFNKEMEPECVQCKAGFTLVDGKCELATPDARTGGCDTTCIVGIVLAIAGAIILSVVVALVVYGVYHFMSNPATKLAKAGTEGLNGFARDNPLYLPPEEIIGDVETA